MTAGYSGTALPKKLGIKPGSSVLITNPPHGFQDTLVPWPDGAIIVATPKQRVDVIVAFALAALEIQDALDLAERVLAANGGLWLGWPKKASRIDTELDFNVVQKMGLATGMVDNKICAISDVYSGLRMVVRKENRKAWPASLEQQP